MLHETPFNYMASWEIPSIYWKITYALIQPIWKTTRVLAELAFACLRRNLAERGSQSVLKFGNGYLTGDYSRRVG